MQTAAPPASDDDFLRPTLPSGPEEEPEDGATTGGDRDENGGDDSGLIFVAVTEPAADVAVRPGTPVDVRFILYDSPGAMVSVQLILARDDNADGEPDGSPVFDETLSFRTGQNAYTLDTAQTLGLLQNGFGRFLIGLRCETVFEQTQLAYGPGSLTIDGQVPTGEWISPDQDLLLNCSECVEVRLFATDNRPVTVQVCLDRDLTPDNGDQWMLIADTQLPAGTSELSRSVDLQGIPPGTYYYHVTICDGIEPTCSFYAHSQGTPRVLTLTSRLIGEFDLSQLADSDEGAILQGFNFNDLAGSAMAAVPDIDGDGDSELLIASRFGEPYLINESGIGFGEAYLLYGDYQRLRGIRSLNAVGNPAENGIPGLVFPGIRMPMNRTWTEGIADALVLDDMDGDDLPELVFGFPRVESLALNDPAFGVDGTPYQHPDLLAYPPELGELEFSVARENGYAGWTINRAQFTRGGVVILSSHNEILANHDLLNRRGDRVVDLHEVGQTFTSMVRCDLVPYVALAVPGGLHCADCEPDESDDNDPGCPNAENCVPDGCDVSGTMWDHCETLVQSSTVLWDVVFEDQGPGGFHQPWTVPAADPPLANPSPFTGSLGMINLLYPPLCACDDVDGDPNTSDDRSGCASSNEWYVWGSGVYPFPCTSAVGLDSWDHDGDSVWTGFYPLDTAPFDCTVGARVLGQQVDDRLGNAVATDGTFLYISAPGHTPTIDDVPQLTEGKDYTQAGVVYAYRVRRFEPTRAQLWIEPGGSWPNVDEEDPDICDYTIPVPHQYVIEDVGSTRNDAPTSVTHDFGGNDCLPGCSASGGAVADDCGTDQVRSPGTAGYDLDRVSQIVGPHRNARIELVRGLGDVNSDGSGDYAITCPNAWADFDDDASGTVGAIFVLFERPTGEGGDLLIERVAAQTNPLRSLWVRGTADAPLGHAVGGAGDFDGDGIDDVILGSPHTDMGRGEAIVVFGSDAALQSPPEGATFDDLVESGLAIRFVGEQPGDLAGATVGGAGDVDGDGKDDILIAAPAGQAGRGVVYLIYGAPFSSTTIDLALVGSLAVPGARFLGRGSGSFLGGVEPGFARTVNPDGVPTPVVSRGFAALGDLDGDGHDDFAISAIQADPAGRTDAGEIYILYGQGE